ncbi:MAG: hypothetical protein WD751_07920 [Anaerolineales bacterium]
MEGFMKVYINYPNPHLTIHGNLHCPDFQKQRKQGQRVLTISGANSGEMLKGFIEGRHKFAANASENDMWLDITLSTYKHSESLVFVIHELLAKKHMPFRRASIEYHNC